MRIFLSVLEMVYIDFGCSDTRLAEAGVKFRVIAKQILVTASILEFGLASL